MTEPTEIWKRIEPTIRHDTGFREVVSKTFIMPDGTKKVFDIFGTEGNQYVNIVALTAINEVVLARQYRPGPEKVMFELPGGAVDEGEEPEAAIQRELLEETGYSSDNVTYLGSSYKDAYFNGVWHAYLATDCIKVAKQELEDREFIDVELMSVDEFMKQAIAGNITDPGAILKVYDKLKSLIKIDN